MSVKGTVTHPGHLVVCLFGRPVSTFSQIKVKRTANNAVYKFTLASILFLTIASSSGGWMPKTSRSFYYWQPAPPSWRPLQWLADPGNPAMNRHAVRTKAGTCHTVKNSGDWGGGNDFNEEQTRSTDAHSWNPGTCP